MPSIELQHSDRSGDSTLQLKSRAHGKLARLSLFSLCCPKSQLADLSFACRLSLLLPAAGFHRRPDIGRYRYPRTDGDGGPRRAFSRDRLLRLSGRIFGLCDLWREPLPLMRRGFDHRADLRWRAGASGHHRLRRLCGTRRRLGADGRRLACRRRVFSARVDRRSSLGSGDNRLSRRDLDPYSRLATAEPARTAASVSVDDPERPPSGNPSRRCQSFHSGDRSRRPGTRRDGRTFQRAHSRCADRPRSCHCSGHPIPSGGARSRRHRKCRGTMAVLVAPIRTRRQARLPRSAEPAHHARRHDPDGGDDALLPVQSRRAARCRPRLCRRRRRQHTGRPLRRLSAQREPAAHGDRGAGRRTLAARRNSSHRPL